jgi:segregation and condensation protein A
LSEYKVALDVYNGPLDLLLFLIRREEIDIYDIPLAHVTAQYIKYVELLQQLDPDGVSEFLVLAATLMEIKSRTLLPRPPADDADEEIVDPRLELVRQLLEYKKFKDAARYLDEAASERAKQHARSPTLPPPPSDEVDIENIDIWDLFDAFNRLLEQTGRREGVHHVGVDDTPIALHAEDILDSIERAGGTQRFDEVFTGRSKPEMIGLFLALLELIRQRRINASQDRPFGTIWLHLLDVTRLDDQAGPDGATAVEPPRAQEKPPVEEGEVKSATVELADGLGEAAPVVTVDAAHNVGVSALPDSRVENPEHPEPDDDAQ